MWQVSPVIPQQVKLRLPLLLPLAWEQCLAFSGGRRGRGPCLLSLLSSAPFLPIFLDNQAGQAIVQRVGIVRGRWLCCFLDKTCSIIRIFTHLPGSAHHYSPHSQNCQTGLQTSQQPELAIT
jgi:hypothetical protein